MAKEIFTISICAILISTGHLLAQDWLSIEQKESVCAFDSLIVSNPQYYVLLDTIEYYWSKCEFARIPSFARISFLDTNHFRVTVMQVIEITPLATSCYMNNIYGVTCYRNHQYFFGATYEWMIDKKSLQKSSSIYVPSYFSAQEYRELTNKTNFIVKKVPQEMFYSYYPMSPFDLDEARTEKYDQLRLEIIFVGDRIICNELETCICTDHFPITDN